MFAWSIDGIPLPPPIPPDPNRLRGMMLGLAIGDALGNTSESQNPSDRFERYGEIRDYLPNHYAEHRRVGLPSDDSQLAFWTIESLLRRGFLDPTDLAETFSSSQIFGSGGTVRSFLHAFRSGNSWDQCGQPSAGNGALMRIAPIVFPHLTNPSPDLWHDVICATALTHNDEAAVVSSVGYVGLLFECLAGDSAAKPEPDWYLERFLHYARPVETDKLYRPRSALKFEGNLCEFVEQFVKPAVKAKLTPLEVSCDWYSGAYLLETVPNVLLILALYGHDPEEAIVRAVNDTRDNDTVGAIVGAVVGALHGAEALPLHWKANLLGRTRENDDGHAFELIEEATSVFCKPDAT